MRWAEFPYRVARRLGNEAEHVQPIVDAFHETQERIHFHMHWLRSASPRVARAYEALVSQVKAQASPLIEQAWASPPVIVPDGMNLAGKYDVDVCDVSEAFLQAVRVELCS